MKLKLRFITVSLIGSQYAYFQDINSCAVVLEQTFNCVLCRFNSIDCSKEGVDKYYVFNRGKCFGSTNDAAKAYKIFNLLA